jgi:hypothetical protein
MSSEARTLTANNAAELAAWCEGQSVVEYDALDDSKTAPGINVPVWGGAEIKRASVGDTIIRNNDGTFQVLNKMHRGEPNG